VRVGYPSCWVINLETACLSEGPSATAEVKPRGIVSSTAFTAVATTSYRRRYLLNRDASLARYA
jgi:hypothetical protein